MIESNFLRPAVCLASPFLLSIALCGIATAQSGQPGEPTQPAFQLQLASRLVIEDVSVVDAAGRPVRNLPRTAFHITDNKIPQTILDLREATPTPETPAVPASGLRTNATLLRNQGTIAAILFDPTSIDLQDQLFLVVQLRKFLDLIPPGVKIAIFRANNQGIPVLLAAPTTDRALLQNVFAHALPALPRPVDSNFQVSVAVLGNLAAYFQNIPGNKAVLWLAGRFPLYVTPNLQLNNNSTNIANDARRSLEQTLQQARLSVYPIDVRGVLQGGPAPNRIIDANAAANDPSTVGTTPLSDSAKIAGQYDSMDQLALATGGTAFYSNNSISKLMATAVTVASASYALSYNPTGQAAADQADGQLHTVRITVDGPYTAHYRTAYISGQPTRNLLANNSQPALDTPATSADSASATEPAGTLTNSPNVLFQARVTAAPGSKPGRQVTIRYVIPTDQLSFDSAGHAQLRLAALAYNASGDILSHSTLDVDTHFDQKQMELARRIGTPADQSLDIARSAQYLLLAVEDLATQRVGTLQLPLSTVALPAAPRP